MSRAKECGRKGGDEEDDVTTRREGRDGWKSSSWREERGEEIAGEEGLWMGEMGSGSGNGSGREWMDMDGEVEVEVYVGGTRATYSLPAYLPPLPYVSQPGWPSTGSSGSPLEPRARWRLLWESYWPRRA